MAKEKKMNTYEVAYFNHDELIIVPVRADSMEINQIGLAFFYVSKENGPSEVTCVFSAYLYIKKLADDRPQPTLMAPLSFTDAQLQLLSTKGMRIPKAPKD